MSATCPVRSRSRTFRRHGRGVSGRHPAIGRQRVDGAARIGNLCEVHPGRRRIVCLRRPGSSIWSSVMRDTDWTPSIVPGDEDRDVCLVVNDFGRRGRAYCETDVEATDLETVIQDLLDGQYWHPAPRRQLQHRGRLVAGYFCRYRRRTAPPLRSADARGADSPAGLH